MTTELLRPDAVSTYNFTTTGATSFGAIDDVVTAPTVPDLTDYVGANTGSKVATFSFPDLRLPDQHVDSITLHVYAETTGAVRTGQAELALSSTSATGVSLGIIS